MSSVAKKQGMGAQLAAADYLTTTVSTIKKVAILYLIAGTWIVFL
ncbi:hypothetical protein AAHB56_25170 [Bacillus thuringiensis]